MKLERWQTNLYTLWVTQIFSMVGFGLGMPFIPYYMQEMGVTNPSTLNYLVGLSATLPAATMAIFSPIWGKLSDLFGRKTMIIRAMLGATVILICYSLTNNVTLFLFLRAMHGVFTGTVSAALTFVSANTPTHKMSYAIGFLTSSNFLGYAIGPVLGGLLAESLGYKNCFFIGSLVMLTGCILVALLLKEDKSTYGKHLENKEELASANSSEAEPHLSTKVVTRFTVLILIVLLVARIARTVFSPFAPLFVQDRLGTLVGAPTYTGFINAASGLGTALAAVTLARLGDKHDKYSLTLLFSFLAILMSAALLPHYPLIVFCGLYALYFFIVGALEPILTSWMSEKIDPTHRGTLFGIIGMINSVALMLSPMIGSAVSVNFSYEAILYLIPLFTIIQLVVLILGKKNATK